MTGNAMGYSVATAGDVNGDGFADVLVGAYAWPGTAAVGRAFAWFGSPSGLGANGIPANAEWSAAGTPAVTNLFGWAVGPAGDVNGDGYGDVIVGGYGYDNGEADEGRAYVFLGSGDKPLMTSGWTAAGPAGSFFGVEARSAGDVNGDGYSDVIVGAYWDANGEPTEGRAYLYLGSPAGPAIFPSWTGESNNASAQFGYSVASAGDVNGDGYGDVIIGAPTHHNPDIEEGRASVYLGSATGLGLVPAWTAEGNQVSALFGHSVASAGDVNGDGFGDVIVGARFYDNGQTKEGRAYVYLGSASGLSSSPVWTAESDQADAEFGRSVAAAGDVNRDGFGDVIVSASYYDVTMGDNAGKAYLYAGGPSGPSATPSWTDDGNNRGASFLGAQVASAGDVNGDGYSDVIVGASSTGFAFVYSGSSTGLSTTPSFTLTETSDEEFGGRVASAGDVNGDGYDDVIVGARLHSSGEVWEGAAYLYLGSASGIVTTAAWQVESNSASAQMGNSVASAGDANGDGFADLLVGVFNDATAPYVNLYYGNALRGLDRAARQVRADGSAPIAFLGRSDSESAFRLRALGRSAAGRGRVKLEWEVKPLGTNFNGTGLARGASFTDTGFPDGSGSAAGLDETVVGLSGGTIYHWRARILSSDPLFPNSPWLTLPYNGRNEADLRMPASAPPSVVGVSPPDFAEGISQATSVVITFSEAVSASSVTTGSLRLKDPSNTPVLATVSVSGTQATLDPTPALAAGTLYTVEVTTAVQDLAGNALTPSFTSSFRTQAAAPAGGRPLPTVSDPSTPPADPALARTGASVAAAGDLNGDGIRDFLSGSPGYQVGANLGAGAALVYLGSTSSTERASPDIIFTGAAAHDRVGVALAGNFDFNLDGRGDILIGAEQVDRTGTPAATGAGRVYLIYFDPTDTTHYPNLANPSLSDTVSLSLVGQMGGIPGVVFTGGSLGDQAGFAVAGRGSPSDPFQPPNPAILLIGVPGFDSPPNPCTDPGKVYAIFSEPALSGTVSLSRVANGAGDEVEGISFAFPPNPCDAGALLGFSVTFPGDVMGGPGEDLAFSAPYADPVVDATTRVDAGIVYVVQGGALSTGVVDVSEIGITIAGTQLLGEQDSALLGFSISGGGDNRVDGFADFLMGAPLFDRTLPFGPEAVLTDTGAVYQTSATLSKGIIEVCLFGTTLAGAVYVGETSGDQLGYAVADVGDVNGDGFDDIALGAPYTDPNSLTDAGTAYVVLGGSAPSLGGIIEVGVVGETLAGFELTGVEDGEHAGSSIAGTGDLNSGGTDDFVVGAPDKNAGADTDAGTVYQVILDDFDNDGTLDGEDCAPTDASVWATSGESIDVVLVDKTTLTWAEPPNRGGVPGTLSYDTIRSPSPSDFIASAVCVETNETDTTTTDSAAPPQGGRFAYLVVARNTCGQGDAGSASSGVPRATLLCP